ncbi:hypothetical protein SmJEL517_g00993 [Synchytrium microbalum]|uniref:Uncharacterized protein n=1 Tax=Synchytrium microbalum TaxID=1806994 RepID=A0A507C839_9FUNG|nr:uncharacterized protein SmJEL517_g00993 [Synchytrium microbalum]TPX37217.1 hypothetical protein SmJEL517_g00993 [Synchytrium microbalum]
MVGLTIQPKPKVQLATDLPVSDVLYVSKACWDGLVLKGAQRPPQPQVIISLTLARWPSVIPWKDDSPQDDLPNTITAYACQLPPKTDPRTPTCFLPVEFLRNHSVFEQDLQLDAVDIEPTALLELEEIILGALDEDSYIQATDGE